MLYVLYCPLYMSLLTELELAIMRFYAMAFCKNYNCNLIPLAFLEAPHTKTNYSYLVLMRKPSDVFSPQY